ncbi:MAG: hypothetical protein KAV00_09895 [Phycisphaerae bacterium]|nr:hypothetical protein [Phycisphaerae bacterium]
MTSRNWAKLTGWCGRGSISLLAAGMFAVLGAAAPASGQIVVPGAYGTDDDFHPYGDITVDLAQAVNRQWDEPPAVLGGGVYDYEKWAVVFKYDGVTIDQGVTVTFSNHPSRAPVVWLVSGDVYINGIIDLDGTTDGFFNEPGPGGFRGGGAYLGTGYQGSAGFGPGGGSILYGDSRYGGEASYATPGNTYYVPVAPTYGNVAIIPLIGGSGGARHGYTGGGSGGGAILIAATGSIVINGQIHANAAGGQKYGSGGAIRLVADEIVGTGTLRADSSGTGKGRIRVEANLIDLDDPGSPAFTQDFPGETATVWPAETAPSLRILSVGGLDVPTDPRASLSFPRADVTLDQTPMPVELIAVETTNVPGNWRVVVRIVPKLGEDFTVEAGRVSGDDTTSLWHAYVELSSGFSVMQARTYDPGARGDKEEEDKGQEEKTEE